MKPLVMVEQPKKRAQQEEEEPVQPTKVQRFQAQQPVKLTKMQRAGTLASMTPKDLELIRYKGLVKTKWLDECRYDDDLGGWILRVEGGPYMTKEEMRDAARDAMVELNMDEKVRLLYKWSVFESEDDNFYLIHVIGTDQ